MECKILLCTILFIVKNVYTSSPRVDPLVLTSQGLIRGQRALDGVYSRFLGIPYALVDITNPFGAALQHPGFDDVFYANDDTIKCPQPNPNIEQQSLDCLTLNVYVPYEASSNNPLPVMVWVHGGQFTNGYAGLYNPRELVERGIIVVTINYRLGVYGFMCLDSPFVPGNQGLKDQYEALLWIRNNIAAFGGNPYNVTLSGQSAGSCSVLLHLYSAKEKLFHKIISQSGTPQAEGMFGEGDVNAAMNIANNLGFNVSDTDQALEVLAQISPDQLVRTVQDLELQLIPCKEKSFSGVNNFVESDPFSLTNERKIDNTPILIGHTNKEGIGMMYSVNDDYVQSDPFYERLRNNFNLNDEELYKMANMIRHFYIGDESLSTDLLSRLEEFESDFKHYHPTNRIVTNLLNEKANPVYQYMFSYTQDDTALGAGHSEDLKYLFQSNPDNAETEANQLITDRIVTLWSNFVKYGNPTPEPSELLPVLWPASQGDARPYLVIDTDLRVESRIYHDRMAFWDLFYSMYGTKHKLVRECLI